MECAAHRYDRIRHHGHHWIEEGTEDDFKWNILNSDLPDLLVPLIGTYVTHIGSAIPGNDFLLGFRGATLMAQGVVDAHVLNNPPIVPLMGTVTCGDPMWRAVLGAQDVAEVYHVDMAAVDKKVLEMLLARPEVVNHEPKAKAVGAAA